MAQRSNLEEDPHPFATSNTKRAPCQPNAGNFGANQLCQLGSFLVRQKNLAATRIGSIQAGAM